MDDLLWKNARVVDLEAWNSPRSPVDIAGFPGDPCSVLPLHSGRYGWREPWWGDYFFVVWLI